MDSIKIAESSNVELLLTLHATNWSTACFFVDKELLVFKVTHLFNKPYDEAIDALLSLMNGGNSSFFWFDEPYGVKIKMEIKAEHVQMSILELKKEFYRNITDNDLELICAFEITLRQLIILFYFQLKKIAVLLEDKEYAVDRSENFPFRKFHLFESKVKSVI